MRKNGYVIIFVIFVVSVFSYVTVGQKTDLKAEADVTAAESAETDAKINGFTFNDYLVLHAMRTIHSAQLTYGNTYGNGNFAGSMSQLQQAGLIDEMLGSGQKYGYSFLMSSTIVTPTSMPSFDLKVTPLDRTRHLLFYMNDNCDIRGGYKKSGFATKTDPILEPCGTSLRTLNEKAVIAAFRSIHSAQITYQANYGAGQFTTLAQLYNAGLLPPNGFVFSFISRGYISNLTLIPANGMSPARFTFNAVPQEYGHTGTRSFYIDQTGVLHGADKNGYPSDQNDPQINE